MSNPSDTHREPRLSVGFTCREMHKSLTFYRDTLGFTLDECWPSEEKPLWASLSLNGQTIMLGSGAEPGACGGGAAVDFHVANTQAMLNETGGGVLVYLHVEDVDGYHRRISENGAMPVTEPETQFYGTRDFALQDPDGYRLMFFSPITLENCQSCAMPLANAKPGDMYCQYCVGENGKLKPYEDVLEGTITGFFMGMQNMSRTDAEVAAKEHLRNQPAWKVHTPA